jgi:hypothetical protein
MEKHKFEEYTELSNMMQEYASFGKFRDWQKFTDILNNTLLKAENSSQTPKSTQWISVKDILPERGKTVIVWKTNEENPHWNTYGIGMNDNNGRWYLDGGTNNFPNITHWMPLSEPPKK